jgi:formylglycine-generating enzyme required for sulfatase activity
MSVSRQFVSCGAAIVVALSVAAARADVFNMGHGLTSLTFVPVGDANNAADPANGYGAVDHNYQMGTYDVTVGQYCEFLNAVAKTDTYGLYNPSLRTGITSQNNPTGPSRINITRGGIPGDYNYTVGGTDNQAGNCPIFDVSWADAARFANWLQNGQPNFKQGFHGEVPGSTETGAYTLNGTNDNSSLLQVKRNPGAAYFLPTLNEWYKAAYYKGGGTNAGYWAYPAQSDTMPGNVLSSTTPNTADYYTCATCSTDVVNELTPVGVFAASPGPYGTFDQGGNVNQWMETSVTDGTYNTRGGDWDHFGTALNAGAGGYDCAPTASDTIVGFRVAASATRSASPLIPSRTSETIIGLRVAASATVPEPGTIALLVAAAASLLLYAWRRRTAS